MAQKTKKIREIMTKDPLTCPADAPVIDAARVMRDSNVGDVLVVDGSDVNGILTDRDIAVRVVAEGRDPASVRVSDVSSTDLVAMDPDDDVDRAVTQMRERAVRRLPVLEGSRPVGIVSIGDLALERDEQSALADISAAPANT